MVSYTILYKISKLFELEMVMPINAPVLLTQITLDEFRQKLAQLYPDLTNEWVLLGTDGCHLCEQVKNNLNIIQKSYIIPKIIELDVMDLDETTLNLVANHIPILITNKAITNYPFGIMDIVGLIEKF